ncbi:MAG: ABC-F family ATP-binding cassette domain-containing protein [Bacteroidetes bacterium]|nr:ABC-F family ATP-binding cassette domain-containing protein [Bacteroidota bacterium]
MISVSNVTVGFGGTYLYDGISFLINARDRVGLAGKNGAGKSTLLKILAGQQKPDSGEVGKPNSFTIGYLPQEMHHNLGKTVFDETFTAFDEVKKVENRISEINHQLEVRTDYESDSYMQMLNELNDLHDRLNVLDADGLQGEIEKTLLGLGFERKDFTRLMDEFSGGWRMRVELAKLLLQKPSILLLDEPTNHLDIESIQWLEDFLKGYYGAVVLVSHDKAFLDNITSRTLEISLGKLHDYKANYSKYLILRKERKDTQLAAAKNQQKFIEKTEQLIDKYRAKANKASFAQSLIKKLDKIEVIEVDADDNTSIKFQFPPAPRSGKVVVEAIDVKKQYDAKLIFSNVNYTIERQEKIAFVGRNGEGKSTMSKLIVGEQKYEGTLNLGANVEIGYYAQNQTEILDGNKTVLETLDEIAVGEVRKGVRNILGSFLFSGDDVDKKVKVLSGGEKSRLAMCRLLLQPYNLLVLDEPTNHLDIKSKEVLKNALLKYDGTLIVVSHDRDFLQGLTNKVFEFKNGNVKQYFGDVNEYLQTRKIDTLNDLNTKQKEQAAAKQAQAKVLVDTAPKDDKQKEIKQLQNQLAKSEKNIEQLEAQIKEFDAKLANPNEYQAVLANKEEFAKYDMLKKSLEAEMSQWEEVQKKLDQLT